MYESHFGLSGSPFQLNPDPAFYFDSRGHRNALAYLKFGAHQGEGFIVVTGEIGAGKTTLVRTLLAGLDPEQVVAAQVVSTQLESGELLQAILMAFGIASASNSKAHLIGSLEAYLTALAAKGKRALLIIDEAQNLSHDAVEELRMLSNFQLGKFGLLQSFLVGQPELRQLLQSKTMEQLRQRVIASCHLGPLAEPETRAYVEHRLRRVDWSGRPQFSAESFGRIHQWTGGVPRKINRLCNRLLLGAFLNNEEQISASLVDSTASELRSEIGEMSDLPQSRETTPKPPDDLVAAVENSVANGQDKSPTQTADGKAAMVDAPAVAPMDSAPEPARIRAKVKLVPGARARVAGANEPAVLNLAHNAPESTEPEPVEAAEAEPAIASTRPARADAQTVLSVVPGFERAASDSIRSPAPLAATVVVGEEKATVRRHIYKQGKLDCPILCVVETAAEFLKAGTLAKAFAQHQGLPDIVAVQISAAAIFEFAEVSARDLSLPAAGLHFEGLNDSYASQTLAVVHLFAEVLSEFNPPGLLLMGSGDAILNCGLLARKLGVPLFRVSAGLRTALGDVDRALNSALIDRLCDAVFPHGQDSYSVLFHEGFKRERLLSAGSLVDDMLGAVLPRTPSALEVLRTSHDPGAWTLSTNGFALVSVQARGQLRSAQGFGLLLDLLCEAAMELPVVWIIDDDAQSQHLRSDLSKRLVDAGVVICGARRYLQHLGLLKNARCLIAGPEAALIEEAAYLRIPSLKLRHDAAAGYLCVSDTPADAASADARRPREMIRQLLGAVQPAASESPDYLDKGTAARIAKDISHWLSQTGGGT
jgi:putative secretion ATPase (PEP-CTERM system associated)